MEPRDCEDYYFINVLPKNRLGGADDLSRKQGFNNILVHFLSE